MSDDDRPRMRLMSWSAIGVILFGAIATVAGAVAMYNHAIVADATGVSGWNPALWLVLLSGAAVVLLGALQLAHAARAQVP